MKTTTQLWTLTLALVAAGCSQEKVCPAGQTACGDACVSLQTDPAHCGACGTACAGGEVCAAGSCAPCTGGDCVPYLFAACADTNQIAGATGRLAPSGPVHTVGTRPVSLAWLDDRLYSADSLGGSVSELRLDLPAPTPVDVSRTFRVDATSALPDLEFVTGSAGLLYVSNAAVGNLDVVDVASGVVIGAARVAQDADVFTGPAGIAIANGKAYVALNGADAVAVVDVSRCAAAPPACGAGSDCSAHGGTACVNGLCVPVGCPGAVKRIRLPSSLASTATGPTPHRLLQVGSRLWITLQNLDRANTFAPAGEGRLAAIDLSTDELLGGPSSPIFVSLGEACRNPSAIVRLGDHLYVSCGYYDFLTTKAKQGMAIVPVSLLSDPPAAGPPIDTQGHVLGSLAACGGQLFAGSTESGDVLRYDPAANALFSAAICPADPRGNSYVSDLTCRP